MSASAATVKSAASYLGTSAKGLQTCLTRAYTAKQAAQYLGQSTVAIQRAFAKFQILTLSLASNATGGVVGITFSGATPAGTVIVAWDDATSDNVTADASGNGSKSHTYSAQATRGIVATDQSTGGTSSTLIVVTKP